MSAWIERQRNILDFALSSLLRRKGNNTALLLVYTLVVFLLASVMFLVYSIRKEAGMLLREGPEMIVQKISAGRHIPIPLAYMDTIRGISGVQSVGARLWGYYYDPVTGANYTVMVPDDHPPASGKVVIGSGVSRTKLVFEGDPMEFRTHEGSTLVLEVERILSHDSELISSDLVLVSKEDFGNLFLSPEGFGTDLVLRVRNPRELSTIALKIAERLPDTRVILREEILRTYEAVFSWRGGIMILILSGGVLAFLILAWDKASGLRPEERKEIGILKAVGWETSDVLVMKFWEGLIVSLTAFFTGLLLAYLHVFFGWAGLFEPVMKGWSVLYPRFRLVPFIEASQMAALFFLTVIPYTVAILIPSWRAATVDPDSVMR